MSDAKLKDIYEIGSGHQFRSKIEPDNDGNVDVIQIKNINDFHQIDTSDLTRVSIAKPSRYVVEPNDVLFLSRGRMFASVVPKNLKIKTIASGYFFVLRARESINPHYVSWYLNGPKFQHEIKSLNTGRRHMAVISKRDFEDLTIPLPTSEKQQEIVRLNQLMVEEATLLEQLKARRAELVRGICNQLASGEINK